MELSCCKHQPRVEFRSAFLPVNCGQPGAAFHVITAQRSITYFDMTSQGHLISKLQSHFLVTWSPTLLFHIFVVAFRHSWPQFLCYLGLNCCNRDSKCSSDLNKTGFLSCNVSVSERPRLMGRLCSLWWSADPGSFRLVTLCAPGLSLSLVLLEPGG